MITVAQLIEKLKTFPPDLEVVGTAWISHWSGDPNDTDMSGEEDAPIDIDNIVEINLAKRGRGRTSKTKYSRAVRIAPSRWNHY